MKKILPYILITVVIITGCKKSELFDDSVEQGLDTRVELAIKGDGIWTSVDTKSYELTAAEELQIKSLDVLIFNSAQILVSRTRLTNPANQNVIQTKSGSGMSIYVVANLNSAVTGNGTANDPLGMATTVTALKNITITNLLVDVLAARTLIMYGSLENVTINPSGSNAVIIPLNYVAAKITVNVRSSPTIPGEDFQLVDWKLTDLARYTYLFGRRVDAVNPSVASDFFTQPSTNTWGDGTIDVGGVQTAVKTTTFYIFENRRGVVTANSDPKLKSGALAPIRSTKLVARGYYRSSGGVVGIDINLMFGANSFNDYNVERTKKYIYNINVKGIADIDIDTRFDDAKIGFQADVSSPMLDAHYDFRPLRINAFKGTTEVEILDQDNNATDPTNFWLRLSNLNITKFVPSGGTFVRLVYDPLTSMNNILPVTHTNAMAMESKWLYLYADEYLDIGLTRTAKIKVVHTPDGAAALEPAIITITQRGILSAGSVGMRVMNSNGVLSNADYRIGMEVIEEAAIGITPGNLVNERTITMQYGFDGTQIIPLSPYTLRNGLDNTLALSLSDIPSGTLRAPYGRTGASTITHDVYDPIYNVYSARYCFEKNRDTNGDGVIKGAEIKWYLPSTEEQLLMYTAGESWSSVVGDRFVIGQIYNASSQITSTTNMVAIFGNGMTAANYLYNPARVRCVRRL